MSNIVNRSQSETYYDYLDRLFTNKLAYGLDCDAIAELMNREFDFEYGESKYRKEWNYFNIGRQYERAIREGNVHTRILLIGDLHVPFNLPVSTFAEHAGKIDTLILNGDSVDMLSISKFPKAYRNSPMDEIVSCRQYIIDLVELIKPKKVIANYGNHELRFQSYFTKNLDTDLLELMPQTPLDLIFNDGFRRYDKASKAKIWYDPLVEVFKDVKVEYTGDWKCRVGNAIFAHPIAYKSGNLATAEKALDYFLRTELERIDSVFMSHTHQSGDVRKGNNLTIYETGAACQVEKMNYTDGKLTNPQQKGYMIVCQDKDGNNIVEQTKRIVM